jgi:hypothetical protein
MLKTRIFELFFGALLAIALFAASFLIGSLPHSTHWWDDPIADFTLLLVLVGLFQVGLFYVQLRFIRDGLKPAEAAAKAAIEGAAAARLNAQALIDAESAQMYVIHLGSNIETMFLHGKRFDNSPTMHGSSSEPPWIEHRLKNYGKSPAILQLVVHGISLENPKLNQTRDFGLGREAMEIVGVGAQSQPIRCTFDQPFTFGDVRSIVTDDRLLFFYGRADFIDHFGRKQTLEWEFLADDGRWSLIAHKNTRENPQ